MFDLDDLDYDPCEDPDAVECPYGCGRLTDDPYGGPCSTCDRRQSVIDDMGW